MRKIGELLGYAIGIAAFLVLIGLAALVLGLMTLGVKSVWQEVLLSSW